MIARHMLIIVVFVSSCLSAACAGDGSLVAPSTSSMSASSESVTSISGRVTGRNTHAGIVGARVTVQAGPMKGASTVTDASGFYTVAVKSGHVMVSVKADNYIDRSETLDISNDITQLDFQLMPFLDN